METKTLLIIESVFAILLAIITNDRIVWLVTCVSIFKTFGIILMLDVAKDSEEK